MLPDYHMHTPLCKHAEGEMTEYLQAARNLNLPEICFTDHAPNPDQYDPKHRMTLEEFPRYKQMVRAIAVSPSPRVLFGVEADYYQGCEKFLREWLPRQELDLVIGSVHCINNWGFDNPDERKIWDNIDVTATWQAYFDLIGRLADTKLFDVVGHLDLPKKFGHRPPEKTLKEIIGPALDKIASAEMVVEINTSGLRKPVKEIYPSLIILQMARERGIQICFGSDAHKPDEVGYEFAAALKLAKHADYSEAARFAGRRQTKYALSET